MNIPEIIKNSTTLANFRGSISCEKKAYLNAVHGDGWKTGENQKFS
jgi:hypothetical protein